jgi:hypothetical protein
VFIIDIILIVILGCLVLGQLYLAVVGREKVIPKLEERTPFEVVSRDDKKITFTTKIEFANEGKQCATIMDAFVRTLLPYEQYDGIAAGGKAELEGAAREDDYFEAVLIQKKESIYLKAFVTLTARKGMTLDEALVHMVDLPVELIYQETGRMPWHYNKARMLLSAEEIAKLAGVELADD